jgi:hypothetical protein
MNFIYLIISASISGIIVNYALMKNSILFMILSIIWMLGSIILGEKLTERKN